jgi:8-oxo-dGTP pyrophosphatase MutT (NUDIX family)
VSQINFYEQSGAVPYFIRDHIIHYVLITSSGGKWIFPKGVKEPDMNPWDSALKEAEEEAGVRGTIFSQEISSYTYKKWGGVCKVRMYLLTVTAILDSWEEDFMRERRICIFEQAKQIIQKRLHKVLVKAHQMITVTMGQNFN